MVFIIILPLNCLLTKKIKFFFNSLPLLSCPQWHLFWKRRSQPKVRNLLYYAMLVKILGAYFWNTGNFLLKNTFCHFCKSNAGCQPVHKSKIIYSHRRDWRLMEKLYLYFDQFRPVSWQLQHRFLLCSAVHHGLAWNWSFQTVVRTVLGRLIYVVPQTAGDTFSGQQKAALAHSFIRQMCFHFRFEPRF